MNAAVGLRSLHGDTGSASLWVVAFAMVVWAFAAAVLVGGSAMAARHRAATAADLSALAAAAVLSESADGSSSSSAGIGRESACAKASSVAAANGGRLVSCAVDGSTVTVVAAVAVGGLARVAVRGGEVSARARAGPA